MRTCVLRTTCLAIALLLPVVLSLPAQAVALDFALVDVAPGDMESYFGTKVVPDLNAAEYGFNFQFKRDGNGTGYDDQMHGHRNLNVISQVYQATQHVTIGTGSGGTTIELQPGDYTFAYTLDFTDLDEILPDSDVQDFQILRTVSNTNLAISNPGPRMALSLLDAGAYNENSEYGDGNGTPPLVAYDDGITMRAVDYTSLVGDKLEYSWDIDTVTPGTKAMVLLFCSPDVEIWQVGWGSQDGNGFEDMADREAVGHTGEGGSVIGDGESIPDSIPLLIPVVPEPASLTLLAVGGLILIGPGRKVMRRRTV